MIAVPLHKMIYTSTTNDSLDFFDSNLVIIKEEVQNDLIQQLLHEIVRVKELIMNYDSIPNRIGLPDSSVLKELVKEAHNSLVNYDIVLMRKYYDLLLNCD